MSASTRPALQALASRQFGVFTRKQALALGVTPRSLSRWVASGEIVEVHPRTFRFLNVPAMIESTWMSAALHIGAPAVLARHTAARLHSLPAPDDGQIHLLDPARSFSSREGITVHRTGQWNPWDLTRTRGFPVTTVTRTLCDLAESLSFGELRKAIAYAVRNGLTDAAALRRDLAWLGPVAGAVNLGKVLDELSPLTHMTRSELEGLYLDVTTKGGVPPIAMNVPVRDATGRRRVIDAEHEGKVPVELDGRIAHGSSLDWGDDNGRANNIVLVGWRSFLRFRWDDLVKRPDEVVRTVRSAIDATRVEAA